MKWNGTTHFPKALLFFWIGSFITLAFWSTSAQAQWKTTKLTDTKIKKVLKPKKLALLIGISRFQNPHWETLKYTRNDTMNMAKVLKNTAKFDRVMVRNNFKNTTRKAVLQAFQQLKKSVKNSMDTVLVYVSAHGSVAHASGKKGHQRYIITADTTKNISKSAISVDEILSILKQLPSKRIVLFLATCYTGIPTSKSRNAPGTKGYLKPLAPLRSRAVQILSAAGYAQPAFESSILKGDVYTHFFLKCLKRLHKEKKNVSAIEAHICSAKPTALFVKKHRNEIQVPQVDSQPGANHDIPLINTDPHSQKRGYFVASGRKGAHQYSIHTMTSKGAKGNSKQNGSIVSSANEEVALMPGKYMVVLKSANGKVLRRRVFQIKAGEIIRWEGGKRQSPSAKNPTDIVGADLLPWVGTSGGNDGMHNRHFSFNLIGGISGGIFGAEIGAGLNITRGDVTGAQIAGAANVIGGRVLGAQIGGAANFVREGHIGVQIGGGFNMNFGTGGGAHLAGGFNFTKGQHYGIQLSGGFNFLSGGIRGIQLTGGFNYAGNVIGAQLATVNVAAGDVKGAQIGALNISSGDVKGVQLGVVNVANRSSFPLGLVNVVRDGRSHFDTWFSADGFAQIAFKHGGDYFHYIYTVGYGAFSELTWNLGIGLGGHIPLKGGFYIDIDLLSQHINHGGWSTELNLMNTFRVIAGWQILPKMAIYGGVSYQVFLSQRYDGAQYPLITSEVLVDRQQPGDLLVRGWPGFLIGLQFL